MIYTQTHSEMAEGDYSLSRSVAPEKKPSPVQQTILDEMTDKDARLFRINETLHWFLEYPDGHKLKLSSKKTGDALVKDRYVVIKGSSPEHMEFRVRVPK